MKTEIIKKEANKVFFDIEIPADEFENAIEEAYKKTKNRYSIPGFRKGKTPRKLIEMNYGVEIFYEDALNIVLDKKYPEALEELDLKVIDRPDVNLEEIKKDEPVLVHIEVEVEPEVELGDYSKIEIEEIDFTATDEMVMEALEEERNKNARVSDKSEGKIEKGDIAKIDFTGFLEDEKFEGGSAEDFDLEIGSGSFIPGFEDQLIDKGVGEHTVNVTFPEEYHEESLKGKPVRFEVVVKEIKSKELPELDDEFAKDISEFDTLDEYKKDFLAKLQERLDEQKKIDTENKVVEKVVGLSKVEVPHVMIHDQVHQEIERFEQRVAQQGFELDKYLELTGTTEEELHERFEPQAERTVKANLVLSAIAKAEGIEVLEEDIDKELNKLAEVYAQDNKEEFVSSMKERGADFLNPGIVNSKVLDLLTERVVYIKEK